MGSLSEKQSLRLTLAVPRIKSPVVSPQQKKMAQNFLTTRGNDNRSLSPGRLLPSIRTPAHSAKSHNSHATLSESNLSRSSTNQQPKNASIFNIMTTRRLARNYLSRFRSNGRPDTGPTLLQPTYQLEPIVKFDVTKVHKAIQHIVDTRMRTFRYSPKTAAVLTKILTTECKEEVKKLCFPRYKIVCQIFIGEKKEQSMTLSSQCVWNTNTDNVVSYCWENNKSFCNVMVFGIYHE